MIAAALTVSKSFSLPLIIRSNSFAASLRASGNAAGIIIATRFASDPLYGQVCQESRAEVARGTSPLPEAVPAGPPGSGRAEPPAAATPRPTPSPAASCKEQLGSRPKAFSAEVWLLGPTADDLVKNNLAASQLLILQPAGLPCRRLRHAACKEHPSGVAPAAGL